MRLLTFFGNGVLCCGGGVFCGGTSMPFLEMAPCNAPPLRQQAGEGAPCENGADYCRDARDLERMFTRGSLCPVSIVEPHVGETVACLGGEAVRPQALTCHSESRGEFPPHLFCTCIQLSHMHLVVALHDDSSPGKAARAAERTRTKAISTKRATAARVTATTRSVAGSGPIRGAR